MTTMDRVTLQPASGCNYVPTRDDLAGIAAPDVALVAWPRVLPPAVAQWLEALPADALPDFRILVDAAAAATAITANLRACWPAEPPLAAWLGDDIASLVGQFAHITSEPVVDIRLERITGNACWRFHRDCVAARLLCTYRGPGTQWVPESEAPTALAQQDRYDGQLHELPAHAVAIFKGSCSGDGAGVLHRSPPIAGSGQARLLLCLNTPSEASPPHLF